RPSRRLLPLRPLPGRLPRCLLLLRLLLLLLRLGHHPRRLRLLRLRRPVDRRRLPHSRLLRLPRCRRHSTSRLGTTAPRQARPRVATRSRTPSPARSCRHSSWPGGAVLRRSSPYISRTTRRTTWSASATPRPVRRSSSSASSASTATTP